VSRGATQEQQADAESARLAVNEPEKMIGTSYQPVWTCFLSQDVGSPDDIEWVNTPVATVDPFGEDANMCPKGVVGTTGALGPTSANKRAVTDDQAYLDGW